MRNHAHLKHHSPDNQRVYVPGANIFAHQRVSGSGTERSVGVADFQVRETHAHLKHHSPDNQRVYVPGANIFAYQRVGGSGTEEDSQLVRI